MRDINDIVKLCEDTYKRVPSVENKEKLDRYTKIKKCWYIPHVTVKDDPSESGAEIHTHGLNYRYNGEIMVDLSAFPKEMYTPIARACVIIINGSLFSNDNPHLGIMSNDLFTATETSTFVTEDDGYLIYDEPYITRVYTPNIRPENSYIFSTNADDLAVTTDGILHRYLDAVKSK